MLKQEYEKIPKGLISMLFRNFFSDTDGEYFFLYPNRGEVKFYETNNRTAGGKIHPQTSEKDT